MELASFGEQATAAVVGASGGIGRALTETLAGSVGVRRVYALSRTPQAFADPKITAAHIDTANEASIAAAANSLTTDLDLLIVASGLLHSGTVQPEKSMREIDGGQMADVLQANTIGPALVAKHFLPHLARGRKSVFAALSARVGSIGDNRLGGWYAYRASKAALNMLIKTLSIEHGRRRPQSAVVALHPGTVDTALSRPFSSRVPAGQLRTAADAAHNLLRVIDGLGPEDSGQVFAWDGSQIPW